MLQFLAPLALLAFCAVVAPLVIHLLSRKPGKTVKIGSLKFLEASESRQLRSFKLTDVPLLLLRMALLTILALLLAKPVWQSSIQPTAATPRGWILIAPEFLHQPHDPRFDQMLDSLVTAGNELHVLAPDFPAVRTHSGEIFTPDPSNINYWSLLREIDQKLPGNVPLWIFAPDRLSYFYGERPTLKRTLKWIAVPGLRENRWIQQALLLKSDSVKLTIGFSDARQTQFTHHDLRFSPQQATLSSNGMPALEMNPTSPSLRLLAKDSYAGDDFFALPAFADSTTVMIWHDHTRAEDARYVRTAVEAVVEFVRLPLIVTSQVISASNDFAQNVDYVFWLAAQPPPQILLQQIAAGARLISDAGALEYESGTNFMTIKTQQTEHVVNLLRRVVATSQGITMWTDGLGERMLEAEPHGKGWHYRFHSRFHPAWNGLVLSAAFPEWLCDFLTAHSKINRGSDQRRMSAGQSQPKMQASTAAAGSTTSATSLHFPFWIFAVTLFAAERWLAKRTKRS